MLRLAMLCTTALLLVACNQKQTGNDQANSGNSAAPVHITNSTQPANDTNSAAPDEFAPIGKGWEASILDAADEKVGIVNYQGEDSKGITLGVHFTRIPVNIAGIPPGIHGVHLHEVGQCRPPKFEVAGAHWNPEGRQHGHDNPQGAHAGDLGNVTLDPAGNGGKTVVIPKGLAHPYGLSLVVHAKADDEKTDPSGNSGDRIACAVLIKAPGT